MASPGPSDNSNGNPYGFINPSHGKSKDPRVKWNAESDRKLLLFGLGKDIKPHEYQTIADTFDEKPTAKAIQERLSKLRREQLQLLEKTGLAGPRTKIHDPPEEKDEPTTPSQPTTPAEPTITPNVAAMLQTMSYADVQAALTLVKMSEVDRALAFAGLTHMKAQQEITAPKGIPIGFPVDFDRSDAQGATSSPPPNKIRKVGGTSTTGTSSPATGTDAEATITYAKEVQRIREQEEKAAAARKAAEAIKLEDAAARKAAAERAAAEDMEGDGLYED